MTASRTFRPFRRRRIATHANSNRARNLAPPAWVNDVVDEVRSLMGVPSKRLLILWRRSPSARLSSGHSKTGKGEIVITAGSDEFDQGDTLLHELAHWLLPRGVNHEKRFWRMYWRLIRHFGINERVALSRSATFSKKATVVFAEARS